MSEPPKVAVLLAAYNGMSWIEEQLSSIHAQSNVCVHIFISIDPSTDGTEEWCVEHARTHVNVTVLAPAGPFNGAARNFFRLIRDVDFSGHDFIAFSDQDDVWYCDKLTRAINKLHERAADCYSSNVIAFWPSGRRMLVDKAQPQVSWDHLFEAAGPGCTYVLRKKVATQFKTLIMKKWDDVQKVALHDWFCYAFARGNGFKWFIDPIPSMEYRQHDNNQVGVNAGLASAVARWRQIAGGWWFDQVRIIASVLEISGPFIVEKRAKNRSGFLIKPFSVIFQCRRRTRDRMVLLLVCLLTSFYALGTCRPV